MPLLRDDQEAFTFLFGIPKQRILPLFSILFNGVHPMASIRDLEIDSLPDSPGPSNDADWEGVMVIIQKVE